MRFFASIKPTLLSLTIMLQLLPPAFANGVGQSELIQPDNLDSATYIQDGGGQAQGLESMLGAQPMNAAGEADFGMAATTAPTQAAEDAEAYLNGSISESVEQQDFDTGSTQRGASMPDIPNMQDMIGEMLAMPMMMATSAGLIGQSFGGYGPGARFYGRGPGVRVYGPGYGVRLSGRGAATGAAGYIMGRTARRMLQRMR